VEVLKTQLERMEVEAKEHMTILKAMEMMENGGGSRDTY
jgi:hypothetical protein